MVCDYLAHGCDPCAVSRHPDLQFQGVEPICLPAVCDPRYLARVGHRQGRVAVNRLRLVSTQEPPKWNPLGFRHQIVKRDVDTSQQFRSCLGVPQGDQGAF